MSKSGKRSKSRIKVPKRVAGVKIPKAVRKGPIVDFVNSSAGKMLVAEALAAAIAAIAYDGADDVKGKVARGAASAQEKLERNTARIAFAFGEAVRAFREALSGPEFAADSGAREAEPVAEAEDSSPPARKKSARFSELSAV